MHKNIFSYSHSHTSDTVVETNKQTKAARACTHKIPL